MKKQNQGQILLITLLLMAVGLTVGLAIVSRSITDVRISQQEEESARAFSIAEAGIEKALLSGGAISGTIGTIDYKVSAQTLGSSEKFDFGASTFAAGDTQTVWLIGHTSNGDLDPDSASNYSERTIEVYWANKGTLPANAPALEITVIYKDGVFKIARYALDPSNNRVQTNHFELAVQAGDNLGEFRKTITLPLAPAVTYALRFKLLYNSSPHILGVKAVGTVTIPQQGNCFTSTATVIQSGITRSVRQCQFYKSPPEITDYVLFSGSDLCKGEACP